MHALKQLVTPSLEAAFHGGDEAEAAEGSSSLYPSPPSTPCACWLEVLCLLGHRLLRARERSVARSAWGALAEALAMPTVNVDAAGWAACFEHLLFPLAFAARASAPMVAGTSVAPEASGEGLALLSGGGGGGGSAPDELAPPPGLDASSTSGEIGSFETPDAFYLRCATLLSR